MSFAGFVVISMFFMPWVALGVALRALWLAKRAARAADDPGMRLLASGGGGVRVRVVGRNAAQAAAAGADDSGRPPLPKDAPRTPPMEGL